MTSTYRPDLRAFLAPGLRGPAAPSRSSMLLALLRLVGGLAGGALGDLPATVPGAEATL